jgi:integrase
MSAAAQAAPAASSTRTPSVTQPVAELGWDELATRAPQLAATMQSYLEQISVSSRATTVGAASLALRHLAAHLTEIDPTCSTVAAIERHHIESYKLALAARPGKRGNTKVSAQTIRHNLGMLHTFFERIIDWDWSDAPRRVPIFIGDLPKADEPTPKFLDDPTAAKFMAALATDPNRRRRLIVELLARTGMRAGEIGGLRDDAMYRVGDTYWLRVPLGKLHNDRSVPLHPLLVGLINDYRAWRGPTATGLLVERDDHQPFDRRTIHRYVQAVARRAGIDHVHPHQLRHTLATQCLNRGMSLEAIAALLGHRSPRMTLVYARIADTVVADQYFTATRAVEAEANTATPAHDGTECDAAARHRRLLGNGHCTRPLELDCRFHTICEGCGVLRDRTRVRHHPAPPTPRRHRTRRPRAHPALRRARARRRQRTAAADTVMPPRTTSRLTTQHRGRCLQHPTTRTRLEPHRVLRCSRSGPGRSPV